MGKEVITPDLSPRCGVNFVDRSIRAVSRLPSFIEPFSEELTAISDGVESFCAMASVVGVVESSAIVSWSSSCVGTGPGIKVSGRGVYLLFRPSGVPVTVFRCDCLHVDCGVIFCLLSLILVWIVRGSIFFCPV